MIVLEPFQHEFLAGALAPGVRDGGAFASTWERKIESCGVFNVPNPRPGR